MRCYGASTYCCMFTFPVNDCMIRQIRISSPNLGRRHNRRWTPTIKAKSVMPTSAPPYSGDPIEILFITPPRWISVGPKSPSHIRKVFFSGQQASEIRWTSVCVLLCMIKHFSVERGHIIHIVFCLVTNRCEKSMAAIKQRKCKDSHHGNFRFVFVVMITCHWVTDSTKAPIQASENQLPGQQFRGCGFIERWTEIKVRN